MAFKANKILNIIKNEIKIFITFLFFILILGIIECIPNFKSFHESNNKYYIITSEGIKAYKNNIIYDVQGFDSEQKIIFENETEIVSYGKFKGYPNIANLIIVKNYVYAVMEKDSVMQYLCDDKIEISGYACEVYPFKCPDLCYYIIGCINSNKEFILYLYENPSYCCESKLLNNTIFNRNITSENFNCQIMNKTNTYEDVLVCFYKYIDSKTITAEIFSVDITGTNIFQINSSTIYLDNDPIIIKSTLNQDGTKCYICYINENNNCQCLMYDINYNKFTFLDTFLNNCMTSISSLHLDYYDISNEYFLYCFQHSTRFNLIKLDENFSKSNNEISGIYDFSGKFKGCTEYYLSSLLYNSFNLTIFGNCNNSISKYEIDENVLIISETSPTTIISPILTTILSTLYLIEISTSIFPYTDFMKSDFNLISSSQDFIKTDEIKHSSTNLVILTINNDNELIIIAKNSNKTKDEIINSIDDIIKDIDIGRIYEI